MTTTSVATVVSPPKIPCRARARARQIVSAARARTAPKPNEGPLAPAANPKRFSQPASVEKWFKRNCNDVLKRLCTAQEKGDVLAWLMTSAAGGAR